MSYQHVPFGSALDLELLLPDGDTGKYPQAHVYDNTGSEVVGSPFNLTHTANALYRNSAYTPSVLGRYYAVFITYNDSGHSVESAKHGRAREVFEVDARISEITAIKLKTDQLTFTESNVNANTQVNSDKSDYSLTIADKDSIADRVWDEPKVGHGTAGTFGEANQGVVSISRADSLDNLDASVSSREAEIDAATRFATTDGKNNAIKAKTDQLQFTGGNVHADAKVVSDKTGYQTTSGDKLAVADAVWNESRGEHTNAGSFGEANQGVLSVARADNLDNLDVTVSSRESETDAASRDSTANTKLDSIQTQTDKMNFTGANIDAQVKVNEDKTNYELSAITKDSIVDLVWNEPKAGHTALGSFGEANQGVVSISRANNLDNLDATVSSRESEVSALFRHSANQADLTSIEGKVDVIDSIVDSVKAQTDKFTFSGTNVNALIKINEDKSNYTLSLTDKQTLVDYVWNELLGDHINSGSTGEALYLITQGLSPAAISSAVWDSLVADYDASGTFGALMAVIDHTVQDNFGALYHSLWGLQAIHTLIQTTSINIVNEVNENEGYILDIIPEIIAARNVIVSEVNQNEVKIDNLALGIIAAKEEIIVEVNENETKIDAVASQIGTIQNNTTTRFVVPDKMLIPSAGSTPYQFHLRLFNPNGDPEAPDSTPTIRIRRLDTGVDMVNGANMTYMGSTGAYYYEWDVESTFAQFPVLVEATVVENGTTRLVPAVSEVTEYQTDFDDIQSQLNIIQGVVNSTQSAVTSPTFGLSAIKVGQSDIIAEVDGNEVKIDLVRNKTNLIPADPATETSVTSISATVLTRPSMTQIQNSLDVMEGRIRGVDDRDLTLVYDKFDTMGFLEETDPRLDNLANLDATVSSRSTLTAAQVWAYVNRTLTGLNLPATEIAKIWNHLSVLSTTPGSMGKLLVDNLDAKVSTRATASQVAAALAGVAQEATLNSGVGSIISEVNANEAKIDTLQSATNAIKIKTDNLPVSPASQTTLTASTSSILNAVSGVDLKTIQIKSKTDNLPINPAKESSVLTIPTNPVLSNDARLNNLDAKISTRSTLVVADLADLATQADVETVTDTLLPEIGTIESKVDSVGVISSAIQAKTNNLPADPASEVSATSNKNDILTEISGISMPVVTPADVWSYANRELTTDLNEFKADVSNLATKTDVIDARSTQYRTRMSTVFDAVTNTQEIIAWAEKDSVRVVGANCSVSVKDKDGMVVWADALATPNVDGVFKFNNVGTTLVTNSNYYVIVSIEVDGQARVAQEPFFTVG